MFAKKVLGYGLLALSLNCLYASPSWAQEVPSSEAELAAALNQKIDKANRVRAEKDTTAPADKVSAKATATESEGPLDAAQRIAMIGGALGLIILGIAMVIKKAREGRIGEGLASDLTVKESVWIGKGQRILLIGVGDRRVLVGATNSALHSLGVFDSDGQFSSIGDLEEEPELKQAREQKSGEFANYIKGELASTLRPSRDERRRMLSQLNSL